MEEWKMVLFLKQNAHTLKKETQGERNERSLFSKCENDVIQMIFHNNVANKISSRVLVIPHFVTDLMILFANSKKEILKA